MNTKAIQSQMKSIKGIRKITKTMEMVSVAKMKRTSSRALLGRPYETAAREFLSHISGEAINEHLLMKSRLATAGEPEHLVLLVGADKGLCGGYNAQLARELLMYIQAHPNTSVVTVGKTADKVARKAGATILASFGLLPEVLDAGEVFSIVRYVIDTYTKNTNIVSCVVLSQKLVSGISTVPEISPLLPMSQFASATPTELNTEYDIEPDPQILLDVVLPGLLEALLLQRILEARAAEHTARMVAMKSATDNATSYYDSLSLTYNRARQANITQEIAEIVGGAAALS